MRGFLAATFCAAIPGLIMVGMACSTGCGGDQGVYALTLGEVAMVTGDFDTAEEALDKLEVTYNLVDGWHDNGPLYEYEPDYDWETARSQFTPVEEFMGGQYVIGAYDVVFISCGMRGAGKFIYNNASERDDALVADDAIVSIVHDYVENGGYIYATDWTYDLIEAAFPDMIEFVGDDLDLDAAQLGEPQTINGRVVDPELQEFLEMDASTNEVAVDFNYDAWAVMESVSSDATVLLEGDFIYKDGADHLEMHDAPLAVVFSVGDKGGKVIFTSFHTEAQFTTDVQRMIDFLVLQFGQAEG